MGKIAKLFKEHKVAVILGILSSLLYDIIKHVLSFSFTGGKFAFHSIVDFIYYYMSTVNDYTMISFISSLFFGCFLGATISVFLLDVFLETKAGISFKSTYSKINNFKFRKCFSILSFIFLTILFLLNVYCCECYNTFYRDMTSIKPYISLSKYDHLCSDWSQMNSYKKFKDIRKNIKNIKEKNGLH